jgi:hypothetical protein
VLLSKGGWKRWLTNQQQGSLRGYDHSLYSAQYLQFATSNFLPYALMAFVCSSPPQGGAKVLSYQPSLECWVNPSAPYQGYAILFVLGYFVSCLWFYVIPYIASLDGIVPSVFLDCAAKRCKSLMELEMFSRSQLVIEDRKIKEYKDPDFKVAAFSLAQQLLGILSTLAVLWPTNNLEVTGALLALTVLELALYALYMARSGGALAPFVLQGERLMYLLQLVLAVVTHSVGLSCASQACTPSDPAWFPAGVALVVLHLLFAGTYLAYLGRLVLYDNNKPTGEKWMVVPPPPQAGTASGGGRSSRVPLRSPSNTSNTFPPSAAATPLTPSLPGSVP